MKTLQIDQNNNFVITQGSLKVIDGINACSQDIKTRIGLNVGEDLQDITKGINYFNEVLGKSVGEDDLKHQIRERILDSDEVLGVDSLEFKSENNKIILTSQITTEYGKVEL